MYRFVCKSVASKYIRYKNMKGTKYRFTYNTSRVKFVKMYMILLKNDYTSLSLSER